MCRKTFSLAELEVGSGDSANLLLSDSASAVSPLQLALRKLVLERTFCGEGGPRQGGDVCSER